LCGEEQGVKQQHYTRATNDGALAAACALLFGAKGRRGLVQRRQGARPRRNDHEVLI
jgi:hypothetical protein